MTICLIIWLLIFSFACWRKLGYGIYLVVFTLPCYLLRFKIFGIPTTVLELEIYILFLTWLIKSLKFKIRILTNWRNRASLSEILGAFKIQKFSIPIIPIGFILLGAVLSTIFSSDLRTSMGILKGWFFDPLIFAFMVFKTLKTKEQIKNILSWLAASGAGVGAIGFFYYFSGNLTFDGRLKVFYLSPNHLAMYLAPCLLTAYYLLTVSQRKILKFLWLIGTILMSVAVYFSYSYGAWSGILFASLFLVVTNFADRRNLSLLKKVFGLAGLIVLTFLLVYFQQDSPKFKNLVESSRSSFYSRMIVWQVAWEIGKDYPFFGIGPGLFQKFYLDYQRYFPPYLEWAVPQPHNLFLAFLVQTGIIGFAGFIWLLIWFFRSGFRRITTRINADISLVLMSLMVYTLIHGLVDTTYWKNDLSLVFWLTIALMALTAKLTPNNRSN